MPLRVIRGASICVVAPATVVSWFDSASGITVLSSRSMSMVVVPVAIPCNVDIVGMWIMVVYETAPRSFAALNTTKFTYAAKITSTSSHQHQCQW